GEAQPEPGPLPAAGGLLLGPHVVERGAGVAREPAALRIVAGQDQGIENGFGAAGLDGLVGAAVCVGVERRDFLPQADALGDIVEEAALVLGGRLLAERLAKGWA